MKIAANNDHLISMPWRQGGHCATILKCVSFRAVKCVQQRHQMLCGKCVYIYIAIRWRHKVAVMTFGADDSAAETHGIGRTPATRASNVRCHGTDHQWLWQIETQSLHQHCFALPSTQWWQLPLLVVELARVVPANSCHC